MTINEFLGDNFVMIYELGGLVILLLVGAHISAIIKRRTIIAVFLLFIELFCYVTERWTQNFPTYSVLRPLLTATLYSIYPMIIIVIMFITSDSMKKKWFFNFGTINMKVVVYLPQSEYNDVKLANTTGATELEAGFTFNSLNVSSSTGSIDLKGATIKNDLKIHHTTGGLDVSDTTAKSLVIETSTGATRLKNVIISESMKIDGSTGSVNFDMCDAATIQVSLSTGSIRGSLLTGKTFTAKTTTGSCKVPSTTGGACVLTTSTGS